VIDQMIQHHMPEAVVIIQSALAVIGYDLFARARVKRAHGVDITPELEAFYGSIRRKWAAKSIEGR